MPWPRRRIVVAVLIGSLVLAALLALVLVKAAERNVLARTLGVLGPGATVQSVSIGWKEIELHGVRVSSAGTPGWPTGDELRADRVRLQIDPRSLSGEGPWRMRSVQIDGGYLSLLRTKEGKLRVLPSSVEHARARRAAATGKPPWRGMRIEQLTIASGSIELHDASLAGRRPHRMLIEQVQARAGPLPLPKLDAVTRFDLNGVLKGVHHDGRLSMDGTLNPSTRDSRVAAKVTGVDLVTLQPYLLKSANADVERGRLDMTIDARVENRRLHAPGTLTLTGLELDSDKGPAATFAGLRRQAVIAALERDGRLQLRFTLEGRIDDPRFSLNENLATRVTAGLAERVGLSVGGVVEGVGNVVKGLLGR